MGTRIDWSEFMEHLEREHRVQTARRQQTFPGYRVVPAYVLVPTEPKSRRRHWLESGIAAAVAAVVLVAAGMSLGLVIAMWAL